MSTEIHAPSPTQPPVSLLLAEFDAPHAVMHAAEVVRDAGYSNWDVHSPFPIHGMDKAMGLSDSKLGWIVLALALTGCIGSVVMIGWMNGVDYPLIIGGKPPLSIPSMVPVTFELTVLFAAFGAVFGMLFLNRLSRHHHPIFESERFRAASDHKFFLSVEASDPRFDLTQTQALLASLHPLSIEVLEDKQDA